MTPASIYSGNRQRRAGSVSRQQKGFSLIEMLVAMVILALSLGVLYQAAAGATRNVRLDERYTYAIQIAQSLLAEHSQLPPGGVNRSGLAGEDFRWELFSTPVPVPMMMPEMAFQIELHEVQVRVHWEGSGQREVKLVTVAPVMRLESDMGLEQEGLQ